MNLAEPGAGKRVCPPGSDFSPEGSWRLSHLSVVASVALCSSAVNMAAITHGALPPFPPTPHRAPATGPTRHPADFRVTCPSTAQPLLDRLVIFYVIRWRLKYEERCLHCKQSVASKAPHVSECLAAPGRLRAGLSCLWPRLPLLMLSWIAGNVCFKAVFVSWSWCKRV